MHIVQTILANQKKCKHKKGMVNVITQCCCDQFPALMGKDGGNQPPGYSKSRSAMMSVFWNEHKADSLHHTRNSVGVVKIGEK